MERNLDRRVEAMVTQGRLTEQEGRAVVTGARDVLASALTVVPASLYGEKEGEARHRLERHCRDRDWPSVALELLMGTDSQGIWIEDRDYWGCGCAIWSTDVLQRVVLMDTGRAICVSLGWHMRCTKERAPTSAGQDPRSMGG